MTSRPNEKSSFGEKVFAFSYDKFMGPVEKKVLHKRRKNLLANLSGRVLEIGSGTGTNFPLYNKSVNIVACEPSFEMVKKAKKKIQKELIQADVEIVQKEVEALTDADYIEADSFDAIVCTLVLCTIPDPEKTLYHFHKWLKPSGKLIILEHIESDHPNVKWWQNKLAPAWKKFAQGCNLNRPTDNLIVKCGFEAMEEEYFNYLIPFYKGVFVKKPSL